MKKLLAIIATLLALLAPAAAQQSTPNWAYGYVPTAAEWNFWFGKKVDWTGSTYCALAGCTFTGPTGVTFTASTALTAGLNIAPGVAPSAPLNGDLWTTSTGVFIRLGGATYQLGGGAVGVRSPQGRLTLTANTPVMSTGVANQTTLRYDCYTGSGVPYFDGVADQIDTIANCEVTTALVSGATAGQVVAGNVYDVWWVSTGANRICIAMSAATGGGGGWASDASGSTTARGTGYTQLDRSTRGYITNKNNITNCFNGATNYGTVLANRATYLGTVYVVTTGQITHNYGGAASGGSSSVLGVWNMYNRVAATATVIDNGATYTYTTNTVRQARASGGNLIGWVSGAPEDGVTASYTARGLTVAATAAAVAWGIGLDTIVAMSQQECTFQAAAAAAITMAATCTVNVAGQSGWHQLTANERGDGVNANTFNVSSTNTFTAIIRY